MGYRYRLGKISKTEAQKYRSLTKEQVNGLFDTEEYSRYSPYYPPEHIELFEIGGYFDCNLEKEEFYNFDFYDVYESEFWIINKNSLKSIIDCFHKKVYEYFKELYEYSENIELETKPEKHFGLTRLNVIQQYFKWKENDWSGKYAINPYWLDEESTDGEIVRSWKYEYSIFNLVYIYRTFDWENDYLIYSAW